MEESFAVDARSTSKRKVASVSQIKYGLLSSRSSEDIDCQNILYVANFEDEQGYAILAADDRIETPILAITDSGYLDDRTIYSVLDLLNEDRTIVDGYPLSGPVFFTIDETDDEIFINPNTVTLYVEINFGYDYALIKVVQ